MRYSQIIEARRNPAKNPKTNTLDALEKYRGQRDVFVSFTMDVGKLSTNNVGRNVSGHKIGINPQSGYSTPLAIYTYPVDYVLETRGNVEFQYDAPFLQVIRAKKTANLWYLKKEDRNDWFSLYSMYDPKAKFTKEDGRRVARHLRAMGYDGVVDYNWDIGKGYGIIHPNEPSQALFLSTSAFDHIETIHNRYGWDSDYTSLYKSKPSAFIAHLKNGNVMEPFNKSVDAFYKGSHGDIERLQKVYHLFPEHIRKAIETDPLSVSEMDWVVGLVKYSPEMQVEIIKKRPNAVPRIIDLDPVLYARNSKPFKFVEGTEAATVLYLVRNHPHIALSLVAGPKGERAYDKLDDETKEELLNHLEQNAPTVANTVKKILA